MNAITPSGNPAFISGSRGLITQDETPAAAMDTQDCVKISGRAGHVGKSGKSKKARTGKTAPVMEGKEPLQREVATTLPLDKHLKEATAYILDKTNAEYPGFQRNTQGQTIKSCQISSHLKDFIAYVRDHGGGDISEMSEKERQSVIKSAMSFIADKIGDEYGMLPHMRGNPMFLSPIQHNVKDYLEFLARENIVLESDGKGNVTATKFRTREEAIAVLTGAQEKAAPSGNSGVTSLDNVIIISGVQLPIHGI